MKTEKQYAFVNGKIFTSNEAMPYAEAMVTEGGKIRWIGAEKDMPKDLDCQRIDLQGKRVLPGFVDCHMHPVMLADFSKKISSLPPVINSIEELAAEIKRVREEQGSDQWIEGWGYDEGKLAERRSPNRYDLDKGAADVPVSIIRTCGHIRCVNSKVLEMAGIDKNTPDPQGGEIERDENGEPTGVLRENARNLVVPLMPELTKEKTVQDLVDLGELLASQGVTTITDMANLDATDYYDFYKEASGKGFRQKVGMYYLWDNFKDVGLDLSGERVDPAQQIHICGLKLIGDGSVSGRTAWMDKPYLGTDDEFGMPVCSDELIESAISFCKENNCQLSMHAMGGRAIERIVDRVYSEEKWTKGETPHLRIEHVTDPTEDSIDKAVEKGIGFVTQPIFLYAEIESYLTNLGTEWMQKTYPVKHMLEKGVKLCFSTDAPATSWATPSDPFPCIKGAVTRTAYDGTDCGQEQRVDVETAVRLYTAESAKIAGFDKVGQLVEGYHADFVVLDQDILEVEPEDIDQIKVVQTYITGEKVYQR